MKALKIIGSILLVLVLVAGTYVGIITKGFKNPPTSKLDYDYNNIQEEYILVIVLLNKLRKKITARNNPDD